MSRYTLCDKCHRTIIANIDDALTTKVLIRDSENGEFEECYDLCADCTLKLTRWLDDKDKSE